MIDCPQCGMEKIYPGVRLCTACEVDERWSLKYDKMREELLTEIDQVLQESSYWQGGRLDTIKWLVQHALMLNEERALACYTAADELPSGAGIEHVTQVVWEKRNDNEAAGTVHPCDQWFWKSCMCKGACSCHFRP